MQIALAPELLSFSGVLCHQRSGVMRDRLGESACKLFNPLIYSLFFQCCVRLTHLMRLAILYFLYLRQNCFQNTSHYNVMIAVCSFRAFKELAHIIRQRSA